MKDRSLIMNPHPKANPKIENSLSSLWALILTFCKIWMSRLDKPPGISLWNSKPFVQPTVGADARDPLILFVSSLPHLYPYKSHRPDLVAHNRGCSCGRASHRLVLETSRPWWVLSVGEGCKPFKSVGRFNLENNERARGEFGVAGDDRSHPIEFGVWMGSAKKDPLTNQRDHR